MNELANTPAADASMMLFSPGHMQALVAFAELMAKSTVTVPDHLKGKPSDCMAITMQAAQWGMNPFAVAQKTHIVSGRLGYEAQLVNAVVQQSNAIRGAFKYEFTGEGMNTECRVGAVLRGETEITWGEWLKNGDVTTRNSPLWKVNPKQQLGYLQVKNWARLYCPGAILGVYSTDELESIDAQTGEIVQTRGAPKPANPTMVERVEPPVWPADAFATQLPRWAKAVSAGLKSADDILTLARSKGALTPEQEASIVALKPAPASPPAERDPFLDDMEAAEREGAAA